MKPIEPIELELLARDRYEPEKCTLVCGSWENHDPMNPTNLVILKTNQTGFLRYILTQIS